MSLILPLFRSSGAYLNHGTKQEWWGVQERIITTKKLLEMLQNRKVSVERENVGKVKQLCSHIHLASPSCALFYG